MLIDSTPYRERNAPLPPQFHNWRLKNGVEDYDLSEMTATQWRKAFDIAQKLMGIDVAAAMNEYHQLPPDLMMLVRFRWDALRGRPINWIVD